METSITFGELGMILFIAACIGLGVYFFVFLKNFNSLVTEARQALQRNQHHIDQMAPDLKEISQNGAQISKELILGAGEVSETALTVNHTIDSLSSYISGLRELISIITELFSSSDKTPS